LGLAPPIAYVRPLYYALVVVGAISAAVSLLPLPALVLVILGLGLVPTSFLALSALFGAIEPADFDHLRGMMATQSLVPRFI
jgi:hypothetical protein